VKVRIAAEAEWKQRKRKRESKLIHIAPFARGMVMKLKIVSSSVTDVKFHSF
jgi:hypothetical protein